MAAAHKQLVRGLVDRSHERVVQARAGQSLPRILSEDASSAAGAVAPELVLNACANERRAPKAGNASEPLRKPRRRGVLAVSASIDALERPRDATHLASSQEQFLEYVHQKSYRPNARRPNDRRQGVLPQAKQLQKLVAAAAEEQDGAHESSKAKLARVLAKLRSHGAFLQARGPQSPPSPSLGDIKNAHLAFLEFKRQGVGCTRSQQRRRVHPSAGLEDGNTTSKTPIRFGDQICLLSALSSLPLAVGADGRSHAAESTAVGPHMTFTVVDFRNPSRRDELTLSDAFWLRVDASALQDGGDRRHHQGDALEALLVDTSYFLGCPGWLDTECTAPPKRRRRGKAGDERSTLFRLAAMKALTPARDYYGDDAATREFAAETNEHVVRLAQWRFAVQQPTHPPGQRNASDPPTADVNDALLNCSLVQLSQDHNVVLSYDGEQRRGVCRPVSRPTRSVAKHAPLDCTWQVRLLHRQPLAASGDAAAASGEGVELDVNDDDPAVQWLREKQALAVRNADKTLGRAGLAQLARQQFERAAAESTAKLVQIELRKAQRAPAYFEQLLHAVASSPPSPEKQPTRLPTLRR